MASFFGSSMRLGGYLVTMIRIIQRGKQCCSAIELIIDDQHGARGYHTVDAAIQSGGWLEGILIPIAIELRKIVFDLSSGIEHCSTLQIHIAEKHITIATNNLFSVKQPGA